jgi:hypothetical protein
MTILLYIVISFFLFKYNQINKTLIIIEKVSFSSYLISFLISFLINPGIPEREFYKKEIIKNKNDLSKFTRCDKCCIIIPKSFNVGHCIYCNICIKNQDHHCVWIGKCIGRYTKIPFYLFLICISCFFINSIFIFITYIKNNF